MKERGRFDVSLLRISQGWLEVTNIINYNFKGLLQGSECFVALITGKVFVWAFLISRIPFSQAR